MPDVNLLADRKSGGVPEAAVRRIRNISLVVLVVYLLAVGVYAGWYYLVVFRTRSLEKELERLTTEVAARAQQEVLVRRLNERSVLVADFIKNRQPVKRFAEVLVGVNTRILEWELMGMGDTQRIKLGVNSSDLAHEKLEYLKNFYNNTRLEKVEFRPEEGWTVLFVVSGLKS